MIDEQISIKLDNFIKRYANADSLIKKQIHYRSVLNISKALLLIRNKKETLVYKKELNQYYDLIFASKHPIDKLESLKNYNAYLFEVSKYLMSKRNFKSRADVQRAILWGLFFDSIFFLGGFSKYYFYFPVLTVLLTIKALLQQKKAIVEKRYFGVGW